MHFIFRVSKKQKNVKLTIHVVTRDRNLRNKSISQIYVNVDISPQHLWQEERGHAVDVANCVYLTLQVVVTNKLTASCQHGEEREGAQFERMKR